MSIDNQKEDVKQPKSSPGDGIRSLRSSYAFRMINYELYAKPSKTININEASNCININQLSFL